MQPQSIRFEVWDRRKRCRRPCRITYEVKHAIQLVDWRRRLIRIRTFYDRHLRQRIVQFLVGDGFQ